MRSKPKFYLKDNKSDKKTPIIMNLKIHSKTFRYSIQKSILPELWDKETQRPTVSKGLIKEYIKHIPNMKVDLYNIKHKIENADRVVRTYLNKLEENGEILDFVKLKEHLDSKFKTAKSSNDKANGEKAPSLNKFIKVFIKGIEDGSITVDSGINYGKKYKPATVKVWKEWRTQFRNFQSHLHKLLHWSDIDLDIYNKLINYFNEKGYLANSVGKQIKHLKAIMRRGYEEGFHDNEFFRSKKFKTLQVDIDTFTLTQEELDSIASLDLSHSKRLDFHRDVFLTGCYTAFRLSDVKRIKPSSIRIEDERKYILLRTQKTDEIVKIPIKPILYDILNKYDYEFPKITEPYLNKDIKEICELAGVADIVVVTQIRGGKTTSKEVPKYETITFHSARRTGATLMYRNGMSTFEIRQITGHKKETTLLKYINISKDQVAESISHNPFFN